MLLSDPNPILDKGAPTSTGSIEETTVLCGILQISLVLEPPRDRYMHGGGDQCLGAKMIICSWSLSVMDINGLPTTFNFDLVQGSSRLIISMGVKAYCNTFNTPEQKKIQMKRPGDKSERISHIYLVPEDKRLRLALAPHPLAKVDTLLSKVSSPRREPLVLCKKIQRYTHASK